MSRGINKVIIIGNAGGDPETRYMPNGNAVTNLTLATSDTWKDKQTGQMQVRTEWHRVAFFGKIAEIAGQYIKKGSKIYIEGRLQTREWEKDGIKRYTTEIIVDMNGSMQLLDSRGDNASGDRPASQQAQQQGTRAPARQAPAQQPQQQQQGTRAPAQQPRTPPVADAYAHQSQQSAAPDYDSFDDDIPFADPYRGRRSLLI